MPTVLVTGGAGYIGSHTVLALQAAGFTPVVLDNLSSGHREALPQDVRFIEQDLSDAEAVRRALDDVKPDAVIHFAAFIEAGESMTDPRRFYHNNVINGIQLMDLLAERKIPVVFSSSAGVYGQPGVTPIPEETPKNPVNVYGETKLIVEHVLEAYHRAYGLNFVALRYFNAAGAHPGGKIGEAHKTKSHLIELALLTALGQRESIKVFGTDYPTRDGTCVRDYIHVDDLASAHVLALQALLEGRVQARAFNVGLGQGFTVKEVLDAADRVTGKPIKREEAPRRAGDPAELVADSARIQTELGWKPRHTSLDEIVQSAWAWHQSHPHDFQA
ncbi:MAG TPA: UDP-glucose 4-epimerase GalE [Deinococcales bacterium]|nr:UDP-glucose 4-epimerase GalE [Deinococcales bacterium]